MAPATSPRSNKIKTTTGPVRFTIQLQFIYSIYQTLYHWPGRGITPAFRTENSRKLALPVRLQDFNTSLGHRSWKLELLLCLVFLLSVPLLRPWVRGDGVGYYAFVRAPLFEQSFDSLTTINARVDSVKSGPTASYPPTSSAANRGRQSPSAIR